MRLGCIAVLVGGYLLWAGGQGLYTVAKNRTPFDVSCQSYATVRPSQEWLNLTGCSLSMLEASYIETGGTVTELFIPARGEADAEDAPVYILVATKDAELLRLANQLIKIEDPAQMMTFSAQHRDKMFPTRDVSGLVRYGVDLDDSERAELAGLDDALADEFVILDEGKSPGFGKSLGMFGGGAILMLVTGGALIGSGSKS